MTAETAPGNGGACPPFSARVSREDGWTVLWAAGELDCTAVPLMAGPLSALPAVPGRLLTLDASQLGFLDVAGLRLLITADERLRSAGSAGLAVRGTSGVVRRIFEVMQVTALLDDREPAVAGRPPRTRELDAARQAAGWSVTDLFVAYFALGGTADLGEVAACLAGDPDSLDVHQRQLAAQAVKERLADLGHADGLLSCSPD
jgi:anti-anti-sigma factor